MIESVKKLLGLGPKTDFGKLINEGAIVIDVRTEVEYASGHISGSVNIPLQKLSGQLKKIDKQKPVLTCCASGMRSASARSLLLSNGFKEVHNAGSWTNLRKYMNR